MDIPILSTHPTELILAMTTEHATRERLDPDQHIGWDGTNLHPPLFSMLFEHLGHPRVLALIHWAVPASSLAFFCHRKTQWQGTGR